MPLWAVLMSLVYLCKRKLTKVVRPTREWGPGDPQVERFGSTFRSLFDVRSVDHFAYFYLHRKHQIICAQVRRAIYEEQHNIAPGRKHNYSSNYNTGYDNQVHYN